MLQPVFSSHPFAPVLPLFGGNQRVRLSPLIQNSKRSPASDQFVRRVNKAVMTLPKYFRDAWRQAGGMVYTGQFMTGIHPDWNDSGENPRGWEETDTWDSVDGVCENKKVSMAEYVWRETNPKPSRFDAGSYLSAERFYDLKNPFAERKGFKLSKLVQPARILRHEAGHALDEFADGKPNTLVSDTREFIRAYHKDINRMSGKERKEWYYYIQPDKRGRLTAAGRSEIFAETFAALYGGGCDKVRYIRKYFKHTMDCVADTLLEVEMRQRRRNARLRG